MRCRSRKPLDAPLPKAAQGMQPLGAASGSTGLQQITKDSDSGALVLSGLLDSPEPSGILVGDKIMVEKTCAACDCKLDEGSIKVKIGGKTVEVCCDECAQKLKEANSSSRLG
jgi:hypothetical protein